MGPNNIRSEQVLNSQLQGADSTCKQDNLEGIPIEPVSGHVAHGDDNTKSGDSKVNPPNYSIMKVPNNTFGQGKELIKLIN